VRVNEPGAQGRQLLAPAHPDDAGEADAALVRALARYAEAPGAEGRAAVLAAIAGSRVLVPVVAVLGEMEIDESGLAVDKSADMAAVLMTGRDGRTALLGFTSLATMADWDPEARPVPVTASTAATAAIQEGAAALVIDVAGPVTFALEGEELHAVAAGWHLVRVGGEFGWLAADSTETGITP